jgi:nicotinamidase-related amidase
MPDAISLNAKSTALLVMDFQAMIVDMLPGGCDELLTRTSELLAAARNAGSLVVYVVVGFRPGMPEISARNKSFSAAKSSGRFAPDNPGVAIHTRMAPAASEVMVTKHRVGAFSGTDLDMVLRANNIETLVLAGISTSGVVLSTLRHAADADYSIVVAADCCADPDPEVHRVLTEKVFPRQATVTDGASVIAALR